MSLHRVEYPGPDAPPLLIAHGLYGSARNWGAIAKRLSKERPVIVVDMRNHGSSRWFGSHTYADMANDLAQEIAPVSDVLGHSMGGKAAMVLALQNPGLVRRLIVADIAPVPYTHSQLPMIKAMEALDLDAVHDRKSADLALSDFVSDAAVRAFLLQSLDIKAKRWTLNLKTLRRDMDRIMGFPDVQGTFPGPAFFLSGGESDYVARDHRSGIKARFPNARFAKIPGAGHWLHAEKPQAFIATVQAFLSAN